MFNSEHDLKVHSSIHTKGSTWKCNQCPKEFNGEYYGDLTNSRALNTYFLIGETVSGYFHVEVLNSSLFIMTQLSKKGMFEFIL